MWSRSTRGTALGGNVANDVEGKSMGGSLVGSDTTNRTKSINASMDLDADLKDIDDLLDFSSLFPGVATGGVATGNNNVGDEGGKSNSSGNSNSSNKISVGLGPFADILEPRARNSREW